MPKSTKARSARSPVAQASKASTTSERKGQKADPASKQARLVALLQSPSGATVAAMMKATGWQPHSVRGFLAGVVRKRLKLKLASRKADGERVYQIVGAECSKPAPRSAKQPRA